MTVLVIVAVGLSITVLCAGLAFTLRPSQRRLSLHAIGPAIFSSAMAEVVVLLAIASQHAWPILFAGCFLGRAFWKLTGQVQVRNCEVVIKRAFWHRRIPFSSISAMRVVPYDADEYGTAYSQLVLETADGSHEDLTDFHDLHILWAMLAGKGIPTEGELRHITGLRRFVYSLVALATLLLATINLWLLRVDVSIFGIRVY